MQAKPKKEKLQAKSKEELRLKQTPGIETQQQVRSPKAKAKKTVQSPNSTVISEELNEYENVYGIIPGHATLRRWATTAEKEQIEKKKYTYNGVEHKGSTQNAVWFTFISKKTLSVMDGRDYILSVSLDIPRGKLVNFSQVSTGGESNFPNHILYKENEHGALGVGRNLIKNKTLTVSAVGKGGKNK